jgi:hypothetical protein
MPTPPRAVPLALAPWLSMLACASGASDRKQAVDSGSQDSGAGRGGPTPTWYQDVAPLVIERCTGCHTDGSIAFNLNDPEIAVALSSTIAAATAERRMPPWHANPVEDCSPTRPWADDSRLSEEEIDLIQDWHAAGAPLGDAESAVEAEAPIAANLDRVDLELIPVAPYTTSAAADEFICFTLDVGNTEELLVTGMEVVPDNRAIAHHTLIFLDPDGESETLAGPDGYYPCSGGSMTEAGGELLGTWIPGAPPTLAPAGAATRIPAGARLVMQMHYHPGGEAGLQDQTRLHLKTTDESGLLRFQQVLMGNAHNEASGLLPGPNDRGEPEFRIPAGVADHVEEMAYELDNGLPTLPITRIGAHMHHVGTEMLIWIEREGEDPECLLANPGWDFNWQRAYSYDVPIAEAPTARGGDTVRLRCTYNNTLEHQGTRDVLAESGLDEPLDIGLGEGSLDEMCIAIIGIVY